MATKTRKAPAKRAESISVSLESRLLALTERAVRATRWKRSQVIANALELYTALPAAHMQRLAALEAEVGADALHERLALMLDRELTMLEFEQLTAELDEEIGDRLPRQMHERDLVALAEAATVDSRAARRVRRARTSRPR